MQKLGETKPVKAWRKRGVFCLLNWNDPLCLEIRHLLHKLTWSEKAQDFRAVGNKRVDVIRNWYADQTYYYVKDHSNQFLWIVTWYKSRGQTDMILFQGTLADKQEAERLLKLLRGEVRWTSQKKP